MTPPVNAAVTSQRPTLDDGGAFLVAADTVSVEVLDCRGMVHWITGRLFSPGDD